MLVPLSWLKNYVPVSMTPKELAHELAMAGTDIGGVDEIGADWDKDKVLVGHVLEVEPHPNADRLTLPTVDLGNGETAKVVCGGPNLAEGQKVAFAREGARLFSTHSGKVEALKAATIRGVVSAGMVCSEVELGLGDDHTGILVLDEDAPAGTPLADYLGDAVLDADVTPNRPDCLSILGVAREVAAITGASVTEPDLSYPEAGEPIADQVNIEIADPALCSRYAASLITGVTVGPSPRWLRDALAKVGQRSINNVVDITNYVMIEYGQPLHAFDLDLIKDRTVIIRAAQAGESIETLDDETLELRPPMLTIADSTNAIALAGVIGGTGTAVNDTTTSLLIESANFDPINTRRTAAALNQKTEASYRFERGIRADLVPRALKRATQLILQEAGGTAAKGIIDLHPGRAEDPVIEVTLERISKVLGVDFEREAVEETLLSLGFEPARPGKDSTMWMTVPYWRADIAIEDDVVEEIARIRGYDSIPTTMLSAPVPHHPPHPERDLRERVRDHLISTGMQEVISYSLTSREVLAAAEALTDGADPLAVANPMSSRLEYLRTSLRGSALQTLASNRRVSRDEELRIFEIGRVYLPRGANGSSLPKEVETVIGLMSGPRLPTSWLGGEAEMGFFDAKGVLESLFGRLGLQSVYERADDPILHPGKSAKVTCGGTKVGVLGEVASGILERFDLDGGAVAMFEIDLASLWAAMSTATAGYRPISRFPESERDMALIVDKAVPSSAVQSIIDRHKLVTESTPVDVYVGEAVPTDKKSVAYRVVFQSSKDTLTAEQVNRAQEDILGRLRRELGAELRA